MGESSHRAKVPRASSTSLPWDMFSHRVYTGGFSPAPAAWCGTFEVSLLREGKLLGLAVAALRVSCLVLVSSTGTAVGVGRVKRNILVDFLKSAFPIDDGGNVLADKLTACVT